MEPYPNRKRFRRRTRLEFAANQLAKLTELVTGSVQVFGVYADPKNWNATDETKDVRNEAGIVVGVERVHTWAGPGSGPELAGHALRRLLGLPERQVDEPKEVEGE